MIESTQSTARTYGGSISGTPAREEDYTLDQLGNWPGYVQKSAGATTLNQTRTHNAANEITDLTVWFDTLQDAAGNITRMPLPTSPTNQWELKYDAWNRLVGIYSYPTSIHLWTFEYDGLGQRIRKAPVVSGDQIDYYYNDQWQVLEERKRVSGTEDPDPIAQYVWHPDYIDALAVRYYDANMDGLLTGTDEGRHWYQQDANFNVTAIIKDDGTVRERYSYTPYGQVTVLDDNFAPDANDATDIGNNYLFTGRERDPNGLQINRERYYAWHLGRWVNQDPIGYEGGEWNLYEYVRSDPVGDRDPFGEWNINPGGGGIGSPPTPPPDSEPPGGPPPGIPGGPWKPIPNPNPGGRSQKWVPIKPPKGQSPGGVSWDPGPPGHWDYDDGKGNRQRYDRDGNPITPGEAHGLGTATKCVLVGGGIAIIAIDIITFPSGEGAAGVAMCRCAFAF